MGASEELHALLAEKGVRCTDGSAQDFVRWVCDHVANHHLGQDKSGLAGEASMAKRLATAEARLEQNLRMRQSLQEECSKAEARAERLRAARPQSALDQTVRQVKETGLSWDSSLRSLSDSVATAASSFSISGVRRADGEDAGRTRYLSIAGLSEYRRADDEFTHALRDRVHVLLLQGVSRKKSFCNMFAVMTYH